MSAFDMTWHLEFVMNQSTYRRVKSEYTMLIRISTLIKFGTNSSKMSKITNTSKDFKYKLYPISYQIDLVFTWKWLTTDHFSS